MSIPAAKYYNQVIYIESVRYRAHWLDAHHSGEAHFTESPQSDVIDAIWSKWIVKKGPGSSILLESMRYRNRYLDAHHSETCRVTYSAYPYDDDWALWYLEEIEDGNVSFRSKRYSGSRLDSNHSGKAHVTNGSGKWSTFKIYQPTVLDRKELLFSYDNTHGTTAVDHSYTETFGISKTKNTSLSVTITTEMGIEIESAFSTFRATMTISSAWSTSKSETWSSEKSRTVTVQVAPGTVKKIYQLTGYYGEGDNQYRVASNHLFFEG